MTQPVTELDPSVYAQHDAALAQTEHEQYDDFDAFWSSTVQAKVRPARIRGQVVTPPADVPLALLNELDGVMGSTDETALHQVTARIFGTDVLGAWIAAGMGLREFQTVIAWAGAAMRGAPITFAEAAALAAEALDAAEAEAAAGKAGTRAERRAAGKGGRKKSGSAGR